MERQSASTAKKILKLKQEKEFVEEDPSMLDAPGEEYHQLDAPCEVIPLVEDVASGGMLELSEAIREYHDSTSMPQMNSTCSADEFFLVTDPAFSGSPPRRAPPPIPVSAPVSLAAAAALVFAPSPDASLSSVAKSESFNSVEERELTVDDIEDFEDDDLDAEEFACSMVVRRSQNDASDLASKLPTLCNRGLIVPSKEKKKETKSKLMRKLGRSKTQSLASQSDCAPGMVGLLETMRAEMEFDAPEPENYWYRVCEGEAAKHIHRPWHAVWKSKRLMNIVSDISGRMDWDFDAAHVVRGEKAANKERWPNLDSDTSPDALATKLQTMTQPWRNLYIATNEPFYNYFDKLRSHFKVHLLDDYKELWGTASEWYNETMLLNGRPVEFDGYMRVAVDTEVFCRAETIKRTG
ncbi:Protein unc-13 homolog [Linum perenne]